MVTRNGGGRVLCTNCEKETEFERVLKNETLDVRGEPIIVDVEYLKCRDCGDEILDPSANDPFELAYREYRRRHALLQPEEITEWRKSHHLSQGELAKLIGVGIVTLNRYENGALQNESHEKLLRLAMDSSNLNKLIEKSEGVFLDAKKKKLLDELKTSDSGDCSIEDSIVLQFGGDETNVLNGFKKLNLAKLFSIVLFYCRKGVPKSKLNKMLFYTDFKHFKDHNFSVTGLRYAHLPYGPVPDKYDMYYAAMSSKGLVEFIEGVFPGGYVGELVKSIKEPDLNLFSDGELRIMASVAEDFKGYSANRIKAFSHGERGYKQTKDGEIISYAYAKDLNY